MSRKLKVLMASSVWLHDVPKEHRASNGGCQFFIVARVPSKKRLAELVGGNVSHLNQMGCHEAAPQYQGVPEKDDTVYYRAEHTVSGFINEWFEYKRPKWLAERTP